jgi:methylamine dehydrogenase accessory protein MauD
MIYLGTAQGVARDGLAPGQRAPDFAAPDLDGRVVSLGELLGRPLLLVFGSPGCGPCRTLVPDLNAFARERRDELSVLFLSRGEVEDARRFAQETGAEVRVAVHPDEKLPEQYKARVTPFAFLIDGEGVVRAKGLANNREHLDLLLRAWRDAGRNGAWTRDETIAQETGR